MNNLNCYANCPIMLQQMNSCPSKEINFNKHELKSNLFEILMVTFSSSPYIIIFINLIFLIRYKTIRSLSIFGMFIIQVKIFNWNQNFFIKLIKDTIRDPRPNYQCNKQFGNPANHSTFYISLILWYTMEYMYLERRFLIKKSKIFLIILISPFIFYSRVYLQYQTINQVRIISNCKDNKWFDFRIFCRDCLVFNDK